MIAPSTHRAVSIVIAAIDNSAAARPVLAAAARLADVVHAGLEAVHVREDGSVTAQAAARQAGARLRELQDPTVEALIRAAEAADVAALVLGARGTPVGRRPTGHVALELITGLSKPLLVVPPHARIPASFRRALVPLDGTRATAVALRKTIELACGAGLEVVLLHVHDADSLPLFGDQPQHEVEAWGAEFATRHFPGTGSSIRVEVRVGPPSFHVLRVAEEAGADLLVLGWSQDLSAGRAVVVREALAGSGVPVLLVPAGTPGSRRRGAPGLT
jgi:nucleotide-binding universal stress UspA family protein